MLDASTNSVTACDGGMRWLMNRACEGTACRAPTVLVPSHWSLEITLWTYPQFPPRTTANGSGFAHGTSFVSENHEPTAFVPN